MQVLLHYVPAFKGVFGMCLVDLRTMDIMYDMLLSNVLAANFKTSHTPYIRGEMVMTKQNVGLILLNNVDGSASALTCL